MSSTLYYQLAAPAMIAVMSEVSLQASIALQILLLTSSRLRESLWLSSVTFFPLCSGFVALLAFQKHQLVVGMIVVTDLGVTCTFARGIN